MTELKYNIVIKEIGVVEGYYDITTQPFSIPHNSSYDFWCSSPNTKKTALDDTTTYSYTSCVSDVSASCSILNCRSCTSSSVCLSCQMGYELVSASTCTKCDFPNVFDKTTKQCFSGIILSNNDFSDMFSENTIFSNLDYQKITLFRIELTMTSLNGVSEVLDYYINTIDFNDFNIILNPSPDSTTITNYPTITKANIET